MAVAKNLKELEVLLKQKIATALGETGKNVVERVAKEHVDSDVYLAYRPKEYESTFELRDSIYTKTPKIKNNTIEVEVKHNTDGINSRSPNQHYSVVEDYERKDVSDWIPYLVHKGKTHPLWGDNGEAYLKPRPYMDNARKELETSKEHIDDLISELKKQGVKAEKI